MKKFWIILPIVIVVVAATMLGLYAAGVFKKSGEEDTPTALAKEVTASAAESGVFRELSENTYFDIKASVKPNDGNFDNYVRVTDNKGDKVPLVVDNNVKLENGVYRVKAAYGFKKRATYRIRVYDAAFVADEYKDLKTFLFTIKGDPQAEPIVETQEGIVETNIAGTDVETVTVAGDTEYIVTLASAAEHRFAAGTVMLAKKPGAELFDEELSLLYAGEIANYAYNGMAAYYVLEESKVEAEREVVRCRLANVDEVLKKADIYQNLTIDENNFSFDEDALRKALENSEFAENLLVAAEETFELFEKDFDYVVNDGKSKGPRQVVNFKVGLDGNKIILNIKYIITVAKGVDIIVGIDNTVTLTPSVNFDYDISLGDLDMDLDLALNIDTETRCYVDMETKGGTIKCQTVDEFKEKFVELLQGKTNEKAIVGAELPIYSYKYPIYCFVLGIEFGLDLNFGITGDINFEYVYNTNIVAGVTYIDGEFSSYKSMETSQTAKDLVLLGKVTAEAGVYVKLTASLLEVAGIGFKVKVGAYAEIGGQLRLDMEAALNKELHIIKGYYVTGGLYLGADFQVKAGIELPVVGYKGWEKTWELAKLKYPLFEYGSKYLVKEILIAGSTIQIPGKSVEFSEVKVNAFDLYKVDDANAVNVPLDSFYVNYVGDAADYITLKDGYVYVNPTVGMEFYAAVELVSKTDETVKATVTFHKTAVMPTCEETFASFDKKEGTGDVVFDVKLNESTFIGVSSSAGGDVKYAVDEKTGKLTLYGTYLAKLPLGEHVFTYKSNKGVLYLTVNVIDSTPIERAAGTPAKKTYSKRAAASVPFALSLNGNKITSVTGLTESEYSVSNAGTLTIYSPAFAAKEAGEYDFVVNAANGTSLTLTVDVVDDRRPDLYCFSFGFGKNSSVSHDVIVTFEKYAYSVEGVTGDITRADYVVEGNSVRISSAYLAKRAQGTYSYDLAFRGADGVVTKTFTIDVWENVSLVAGNAYAVYDKNAPANVEYVVYSSTGSVAIAGVPSAKYTLSGNVLTIRKEVFEDLDLGKHTYTASASGSSVELTLEVIDTTVPDLSLADGGKLVLSYDKSAGVAPSFDLALGTASFDKVEGNGVVYDVTKKAGKTVVTFDKNYLDSLAYGEYEYSVLTSVNRMTILVKITDTRAPYAKTDTVIAYTKGGNADATVSFENFGYDVVSLSVTGSDAPALGEYIFDKDTGVFTLTKDYLETLTENDYTTIVLTFNDETSTVQRITLAVSSK